MAENAKPVGSRKSSRETAMPLNDMDPMPFGKHARTPMQDVPASYLHWLWTNGKKEDKQCPVAGYIRENLNHLKTEHPDGIW